jgi:hypothetical protein
MALTDEEIYNQLKDLPDFDRLPLPKYFYEKFNIPPPKILTPMEAVKLAFDVANAPGPLVKTEHREAAPGGVRPLIEVEPVKVEVITETPIENVLETLEHKESPSTTQVCSDISGCRQDISG